MRSKPLTAVLCLLAAASCNRDQSAIPRLIVLGVDGMDPAFVEKHWDALPNLRGLRDSGYFGKLATTTPPQSPVAWSTFITGLEPDEHGLYDFVHRDPATLRPFSSMSRTEAPKLVLPLGPYLFPLSTSRISSQRRGKPFWQTLSQLGIPVIVQRMPTNYPPIAAGSGLSGMGTPDLAGTQGTFTFFTDDPMELERLTAGGQIRKLKLNNGRALLNLPGPLNPLRKDQAPTTSLITVDVDDKNDAARFEVGGEKVLLRQGEWSDWLRVKFTLIPYVSSVQGMVRIFAKQLHPGLEIYISPVNADPSAPALPVSTPARYSSDMEADIGPYFTLGIPEDTAALRQSVFNLAEFQRHAELIFEEESKLLDASLRQYQGGFLFFYFSSVDQNSHVLWGQHEEALLKVYQAIDRCVGTVRRRQPKAELMILSDHGFTSFDRAVHLNAWLNQRGFLALRGAAGPDAGLETFDWQATEAYAIGLNGLYLNRKGRERQGIVLAGRMSEALLANLREQMLAWRDPLNGRAVVEIVTATHASAANRNVAPDLIVGYAPGYRASWQTGLGTVPAELIEDNRDAWIGDHCINPADIPGVLFSSRRINPRGPRLQDVTATVLKRFGVPASATVPSRDF